MSINRPKVRGDQLLLDDSYELLSIVGRGGNSLVYNARPIDELRGELNLPETVAVKLFTDASSSPELLERIQREAMCLKAINHPRVVKIYDYSASLELSYLVLEHAPGGDVKGILERKGKLEADAALRFGIQLLDALTVIHGAEILHRDIKPENLLIAEDGTIRLSDFGVSKFFYEQEQLPEDNIVRGTLGYIAPEQLIGEQETAATDIFAAAVTIFEMLTGRLPFEGASLTGMLESMMNGTQLKVADIAGSKFRALDNVLARGLASNPADRFQSALEFRRALEEVIWALDHEANTTRARVAVRLSALNAQNDESDPDVTPKMIPARRKPSLRLIAGTAALIVVYAIANQGGSATANLRRNAPAAQVEAASAWGWLTNWFAPSEGAYEQVKVLADSARVGILYNFLGDGENVLFSTSPAPTGVKDSFLLSIAIAGWKPQLISLSPNAKSRELLVSAGGLNFALEISAENRESGAIVSGKFKDLATGRESRWAAF